MHIHYVGMTYITTAHLSLVCIKLELGFAITTLHFVLLPVTLHCQDVPKVCGGACITVGAVPLQMAYLVNDVPIVCSVVTG